MTRPRDELDLDSRIDYLLEQMLELTEEERLAFVEQFGNAARRAGVTADQAAATFRELARMIARETEK